MGRREKKKTRQTNWRGVMNHRPQPSDFGLSPLADNVDSLTQRQRVRVSRITHGIGGGMRISEDTDAYRSAPANEITDRRGMRVLSLTGSRAAFGIYAGVVLAVLLVAHIQLRFTIHDMNMQQHALQTVQRNLQRQSNFLDQHITSLIDLDRLKEHALMNLNMVEVERGPELLVEANMAEKYSEEAIAAARVQREREIAEAQSQEKRHPFRQLADLALAFADRQ